MLTYLWSLLDLLCFRFDDNVGEERHVAGKDFTKTDETTESEKEEQVSALKLHASQSSIAQMSQETNSAVHSCCFKFLNCIGMCCMITYTICPPIPCCIVKKVAFRPPKKGESYKIIVRDNRGNHFEVEDAREARKFSKVYIHPVLVEDLPKIKDLDKYLKIEMRTTNGFVVKSSSGNYLACAVFDPCVGAELNDEESVNKVVLFAQPNSSDIGAFMQPFLPASLHHFSSTVGCRFYAFDYSGYGRSTGAISEQNMYSDIDSVFNEVVKREGSKVQVILIGYSIGTAAVVDLAAKNYQRVIGVVLLAPFTSGWRLVKNNPRMDDAFCLDCFKNIDKIGTVNVPVFICHGTKDTVIPMLHGQVLYEHTKLKVDPLIIEGASHISILNASDRNTQTAIRYFVAVVDKYKQLVKDGAPLEVRKVLANYQV